MAVGVIVGLSISGKFAFLGLSAQEYDRRPAPEEIWRFGHRQEEDIMHRLLSTRLEAIEENRKKLEAKATRQLMDAELTEAPRLPRPPEDQPEDRVSNFAPGWLSRAITRRVRAEVKKELENTLLRDGESSGLPPDPKEPPPLPPPPPQRPDPDVRGPRPERSASGVTATGG